MNEKNIGKSIIKTIGNNDLKDIIIDAAELGLDAITDSEIVDDVPVIGTLYKLFKTGVTIRDRRFMKNILLFLINLKDIDEERRMIFIEKHYQNADQSDNIGEKILYILDKLNDLGQVEILSLFFRKYIEGEIDLDTFYDLYYTTQNMNHHKFKFLVLLEKEAVYRFEEDKEYFMKLEILDSSHGITRIGRLFVDTINNSEKLLRKYFFQLLTSLILYHDETMERILKHEQLQELSLLELKKYITNCRIEILRNGKFFGARYEYVEADIKTVIYKSETKYYISI